MNDREIKNKLEFDKVINRVKNYCYSDLGIEKCEKIKFITDAEELDYELNKTLEMKNILLSEEYLQLDNLRDIRSSLQKIKIENSYVRPEEFLWILNFLKISRIIKNFFKEKSLNEGYNLLYELTKDLFYDKFLEHNIEESIDESGNVKDSASRELKQIRVNLISKSESLRKSLTKILREISEKEYSQEEIITQREGRYVIPIKTENKRKVAGIIHSTSASGATVFIEPVSIIDLNNELSELKFNEKREIERILKELSKLLFKYYSELLVNCKILSEIDFLQAKAKYANEIIGNKPSINKEKLKLINAFHPVLLQTHKRTEITPLNLEIGETNNTLIVTGPNAGGKTVSLKTVGLLQFMLQSGLLIPASEYSEFCIFEKIFISIGDEQSLENDLSTFSSHLLKIKEILENANNHSLVLIDEICSGTDPTLGSALASAIIKSLSEKNCFSIVTTHIGDLKKFAYNTDNIENASLEFDVSTLSPTYKFVTSIPGQSFTFEIAQKYNFPQDILSQANEYLNKNELGLEELIKELNETKQKYDTLKNQYDIENSRLKGLINLYEEKNEELRKNERQIKKQAKVEAEKILEDANKLIEKTIKEIRENKNISPKTIKEKFNEEVNNIIPLNVAEDVEKELHEINIGDKVRLKNSHVVGEVISKDNGNITVNSNGITLKSKVKDLEKVSSKEIRKIDRESSIEILDKKISDSLDLRGKYVSEVKDLIDIFLMESRINGLEKVSIVHGKGTGKVREEVKKVLSKNKDVKSYRYGNWNEGDTGVTIVEL